MNNAKITTQNTPTITATCQAFPFCWAKRISADRMLCRISFGIGWKLQCAVMRYFPTLLAQCHSPAAACQATNCLAGNEPGSESRQDGDHSYRSLNESRSIPSVSIGRDNGSS